MFEILRIPMKEGCSTVDRCEEKQTGIDEYELANAPFGFLVEVKVLTFRRNDLTCCHVSKPSAQSTSNRDASEYSQALGLSIVD